MRGPLALRGWVLEPVSWDDAWADPYDAAAVRATWDYHLRVEPFLARLEAMAERVPLVNPLELIRWNADKRYLLDLHREGIPIVPTVVSRGLPGLSEYFGRWGNRTVVVKPVVGASAFKTFHLGPDDPPHAAALAIGDALCLVQPFVDAVLDSGEWSLIYFGGGFSHAVLKRPAPGDFRVQEELGGSSRAAEPPQVLRALAERVLGTLPRRPVWARLDLVEGTVGPVVMEVELIEPVLFLDLDPQAPDRMAQALADSLSRP